MRKIAKADEVSFEGFSKTLLFFRILSSQEPQLQRLILSRNLKILSPVVGLILLEISKVVLVFVLISLDLNNQWQIR